VAIATRAGDRAFCAGNDLKPFKQVALRRHAAARLNWLHLYR
jgi:enoyl-CoA hydratase/carnithine racemase